MWPFLSLFQVVKRDFPIALPKVAVAFTSPAPHFWHIDFPPTDWEALQEE
jgi:hypothetical protein